ncbi:LysM peptidoglycan-binding domain-containing protein [Actinotalea ferrariae]|uniref:LysM peptidoglycan-binding domain-containing protein n=1 Tax=Actinotalea ferrariae TaxID=1386098 RepID=UPI001C8BEA36|nr:LysM peptidoglycan-binding domain-containing protein [Actinotalea ferrariae]MBX9244694.1 LysM peptidoglycan-binding domain-containing protein [Actinotalea ferrariae]
MSAITWDEGPALSVQLRRRRSTGGSTPASGAPAAAPAADRLARTAHAEAVRSTGSLRLTGRGRVVVWALALAVAGGVGLSAQSAGADAPGTATPVQTHVVGAGETLWGIAATVAAPGEDLRDVVDELVELNGLGDAGLQAGQQILLPTD